MAAPAATDLATAYALLADVKAKFVAHTGEPGVHAATVVSSVSSPDPATVDQAVNLIEELRQLFRLHAELVPPHKAPDSRSVTVPVPVGIDVPTLVALAADIQAKFSSHAASLFQHEVADPAGALLAPQPTDLASAIAALNEVRPLAVAHATNLTAHHAFDPAFAVTSPAAFDYASAVTLASEIRTKLNAHFLVPGTHEFKAPPSIPDTSVSSFDPGKPDPTVASVNELVAAYNRHLAQYRVHAIDDAGRACPYGPASDVAGASAAANSLKALFNAHLTASSGESGKVHVSDDAVNAVTAPDATGLATLRTLDQALWAAFSAHLVQPGVHGGSVVIRLEAPDRVVYQSARFFNESEGDEGQTSPFSDDDAVAVLTNTMTLEQVIIRY